MIIADDSNVINVGCVRKRKPDIFSMRKGMRTTKRHTEALEGTSAKPRFGLLLIKVHETIIYVFSDRSLGMF
jgi:hypothetical protein